jgi:UDP-glucose 4-epimerase
MKTLLITGGAGFLGAQTVLRLAKAHPNDLLIRVLDSAPLAATIYDRIRSQNICYVQGDMTRLSDFTKACSGADVLMHLARSEDASAYSDLLDYNCTMTDNIARFAGSAKLDKIILASSFQVYGKSAVAGVPENTECQPITDYAKSKYAGEQMLSRLSPETGISAVILRYFNIYGPGASTGILKLLTDRITGTIGAVDPEIELALRNDGQDSRDYIHISDAVSALELALHDPAARHEGVPESELDRDAPKLPLCSVFNVGTGRCTNVEMLLTLFEQASGIHILARFGEKQDPIRTISADCSRMSGLLGLVPAVSLEKGMNDLIGGTRFAKSSV